MCNITQKKRYENINVLIIDKSIDLEVLELIARSSSLELNFSYIEKSRRFLRNL